MAYNKDIAAVLVGINKYPRPYPALRGCVNDIVIAKKMLVETYKADPVNIQMLADERATKLAFEERLEWLLEQPNPKKLFWYSGHGAQVPNAPYDHVTDYEKDGMDEVLCPVNFAWDRDHYVSDDYLSTVIKRVGKQHKLTMVLDCCHSGTIDRSLAMEVSGTPRYIPTPLDLRSRISTYDVVERGDITERKTPKWFWKKRLFLNKIKVRSKPLNDNVFVLTACREDETAADAFFRENDKGEGRYQGAFSFFMQYVLLQQPDISYARLMKRTFRLLRRYQYPQTVQYIGPKHANRIHFMD